MKQLFLGDKEQLKKNVLLWVKSAADLFGYLVDNGLESHEASNRVREEVLCPSVPPSREKPLSERLKKRIRRWRESLLPPQTETPE